MPRGASGADKLQFPGVRAPPVKGPAAARGTVGSGSAVGGGPGQGTERRAWLAGLQAPQLRHPVAHGRPGFSGHLCHSPKCVSALHQTGRLPLVSGFLSFKISGVSESSLFKWGKKSAAPPGNRTRVARMGILHDTTTPAALLEVVAAVKSRDCDAASPLRMRHDWRRAQRKGAGDCMGGPSWRGRDGPTQQQVEGRLGELLKCRQPAPPTSQPPRAQPFAQPPGPWPLSSPGPRLVFNRVNGRRAPSTSPSLEGTQETYTLAHEENVRFVSEAWQQVQQQLDGGPAGEGGPRPVQYVERIPNPRLQNFVPIDLDEWWAQQFLARITSCS
uniref:MAPK regulated corepressor interacting protein 2 n=1 Tax=Pongo abelii TaxID=9601 RepID=A0A8I5YR75_PONAB